MSEDEIKLACGNDSTMILVIKALNTLFRLSFHEVYNLNSEHLLN